MIYLDNSATTPICEEAKSALKQAMECYGNPSSLHSVGFEATKALSNARSSVMKALGAKNGRIIFTSCGSEGADLAIFGTVEAKERRISNRILTTDSEHPAVENAMCVLEKRGFEVIRIPTLHGELDRDAIRSALEKPIFFASMMLVNNETGAVYNVGEVFSEIKRRYPDAVCHTDAVQALFKVRFTPATLNADYISVSGHKIHAPKGVGALWVSDRIIKERRLSPRICGGGQENGFRSGTENTIGIAAFAAAAEAGFSNLAKDGPYMADLREYVIESLEQLSDELVLNRPKLAAPHIISVTLPNIKSETMLHFLSSKGICVSSGSACSSHSNKPSRALMAFGLTSHAADCTLRISLSRYNTKEEIDALCDAIHEGLQKLIRIKQITVR